MEYLSTQTIVLALAIGFSIAAAVVGSCYAIAARKDAKRKPLGDYSLKRNISRNGDDDWVLKRHNARRATRWFYDFNVALERSKNYAREAEAILMIKNADGSIQETFDYTTKKS